VHESWCDNELRLSILIRNENELLWSSADKVILVVYLIKFVFSCLSYLDWIGSGTSWFGFNSVRVISGSDLHRVNKSSGQFGFDSCHIGFRVGSSRFNIRISGRNQFNSFSYWFGSDFRLFGSGHFCQVYMIHCPCSLMPQSGISKLACKYQSIQKKRKLTISIDKW